MEWSDRVRIFRRTVVLAAYFGLAIVGSPQRALAQTPAEIEAAALKEGQLVWYAAMRSDQADMLVKQFMSDYPGIKLSMVHFASGDITARILTEQRGRQFTADIASASSFAISQLKAQKALEAFQLPAEAVKGMAKGSFDPQGFWVSQYGLTFPISYNSQKLKDFGLPTPTSLEDFAKPEWKGKFAISSAYYDWYEGYSDAIGRGKAKDLITRLAANQPIIHDESGILLQLLETGEYAATFHVYGYNTAEDKGKGKAVDIVNAAPVIVSLQTGGILLQAPHPNAAKLFQLWMTSPKTQTFIAQTLGRTSTHDGIVNKAGVWDTSKAVYRITDPDEQVLQGRSFQKEYESTFGLHR